MRGGEMDILNHFGLILSDSSKINPKILGSTPRPASKIKFGSLKNFRIFVRQNKNNEKYYN